MDPRKPTLQGVVRGGEIFLSLVFWNTYVNLYRSPHPELRSPKRLSANETVRVSSWSREDYIDVRYHLAYFVCLVPHPNKVA